MTKLIAAFVATLFAGAAFAQAPASTAHTPVPDTKTEVKAEAKVDKTEAKAEEKIAKAKAEEKETDAKADAKDLEAFRTAIMKMMSTLQLEKDLGTTLSKAYQEALEHSASTAH